jgi:hypothetical protein
MCADIIDVNRQYCGDGVKRVVELNGMKCTANPQFTQAFILQADAGVVVTSYLGEYVVEGAVAKHQIALPPGGKSGDILTLRFWNSPLSL